MRWVAMLISLLMLWYAVAVTAGHILLRTTVTPQEAWVGQRVVLQVDVLGEDGWAQISRFGEVDLSGAYLIRTDTQGSRLQETIGGVAYTGQSYEFSIYPQLAGTVEVPAIPVEVTTKTWGADATQTVQQKQTSAITIKAKVPPGAEDVVGLISTTHFNAEQQWAPAIDDPKVGDALTRTLTMQAEGVSAMAFTPLQYDDLPGVGIYPAEPTVKDSTDRGSLTGMRAENVTYVFERAGTVTVPDVVLTWWNVSAQKLERVTLPGLELDVAAAAAGGTTAGQVSGIGRFDWRGLVMPGVVLLVLAYLLLRARKTLAQRWRTWRGRRRESEARYYRLVVKSIRSKDAHLALRELMRWLDRVNETGRPAQLQDFLCRYAGADARATVNQLLLSVATDGRLADTAPLLDVVMKARKRWHETCQRKLNAPFELPELNG